MSLSAKPLQPRPCSVCDKPFQPWNSMAKVCGYRCAAKVPKLSRKEEAAKTKAQKEAMKTLPELRAEAQDAFNAYCRQRDKDLPCFCCGKWPSGTDAIRGGQWDAGHMFGRGAHPELAFEEANVNRQAKGCNRGDWNRIEGEKELIRRWGQDAIDKLKEYRPPLHRTKDDFRTIRDTYRTKLKELKP